MRKAVLGCDVEDVVFLNWYIDKDRFQRKYEDRVLGNHGDSFQIGDVGNRAGLRKGHRYFLIMI